MGVLSPIPLVQNHITKIMLNIASYSLSKMQQKCPDKFDYDADGCVHIYCDGVVSGNIDAQVSAYAVWFNTHHHANESKVITVVVPTIRRRYLR